jgi:hypothetical protein
MATITVKDASGVTQTIGKVVNTGRALATDGHSVTLSSEDFSVLSSAATSALQSTQIALLSSAATSALQSSQLSELSSIRSIGAIQTSQLSALPQALAEYSIPILDCSFTKTGSGLIAEEMVQIGSTGTGMTVAQQYGNLLVDTGTTVNSEFLARSTGAVTAAHFVRVKSQLSQRIVNQHFGLYLADLIATGAAFTTNATGLLITVTLPSGHGFTSQNIGQSCFLGGGVGAAVIVPGRYAITAVTGNNVTFSPVFDCTWSRSTTTATITFIGGNPIFAIGESATVSATSDATAIPNGVVSLLTQASGGVATFTCLNAGATAGTLTLTMTAKAWTPSASGTITVYGWNCISMIKTGVTATVTQFDSQRRGWASGTTLATTATDAAPGHLLQISGDTVSENFCDALLASATTAMAVTQRASRLESVVDALTPLYLFIQAFNGVTAPASTTRLTVGKFSLEEITINKQLVAGFSQGGSQAGVRATIDSGTITTLSGTTTLTPGTAATNLGKAEDGAHTSADTGVFVLGVRRDLVLSTETGATGDYSAIATNRFGGVLIAPFEKNCRAYRAASSFTVAASATDIWDLFGNATTSVVLLKIRVSGIQTTGGLVDIGVIRRSTANSAGTRVAQTAVLLDTADGASSSISGHYTANPTTGTSLGYIARQYGIFPASASPIAGNVVEFDFASKTKGVLLSGTTQGVAVNLNGVTVTGGTFIIEAEWIEYV